MPERDLRLGIRVDVDVNGQPRIRALEGQVNRLSAAQVRGAAASRGAAGAFRLYGAQGQVVSTVSRGMARATDQVTEATDRAGKTFLEAHGRHVRYLAGFAGVEVLRRGIGSVIRRADAYTQVTNSARQASAAEGNYAETLQAVYAVAQRTRGSLGGVAQLYQRLELSSSELDASQARLLAVTEGVSQSLAVQGTSSAQAGGSLLQLAQALGSGRVEAEEFNSLIDGMPVLLRVAARHIDGAGGSVARLRQQVRDGEVESREFFEAIEAGLPELQAEFDRAGATFDQARTRIDNALTVLIGRSAETSLAADLASASLGGVASVLETINPRALTALAQATAAISVVRLLRYAAATDAGRRALEALRPAALTAAQATRAQAIAQQRGAVAAGVYTAATRTATTATRGLSAAMAFLGGPVGLALLAAYGVVELVRANRDLDDSLAVLPEGFDRWGDSIRETREELEALTEAQREAVRIGIEDRIDAAVQELEDARDRLLRARIGGVGAGGRLGGDPNLVDARRVSLAEAEVDTVQGNLDALRQRLGRFSAAQVDLVEASAAAAVSAIRIATEDGVTVARLAAREFGSGGGELAAEDLDRAVEAEGDRLAEVLRLERQLATERERIQLDYQANVRKIESVADGEQRERLLQRAARIRDASVEKVYERAAAAAEKLAAAEAKATANRQAAIDVLAQLADENARIAAGGEVAFQRIEREREERELLQDILERYPQAAPDVINAVYEETLRRGELVTALEAESAAREKVQTAAAGSLEMLPDLTGGTIGYTASVSGLDEALGVTGEALRRITGSLGHFAGQSKRAFRFQKAASLATAVVSTAEGVSRALAKDPPLNFVLAAAVAAAGALQIAAIRAQAPPTAFRYGGVIDRRSEFGFGGGRRGVAGEAGLEAILPLRRGVGGRLGVEAIGGGGRVIEINVGGVTVQAPAGIDDPDSFGREAAYGLTRALRPVIRELLLDEQRPGGALNRTDRAA